MTDSPTVPGFESPSLGASKPGAGPAFELKFLLKPELAQQVEDWARRFLVADPHGEAALGGAYRTTSIYSDTPELHVYYRQPAYKRRKFRVRRYGAAPWMFLERKSKSGDRVSKRRVTIPQQHLNWLAQEAVQEDWTGHWFHRSVLLRRLQPACQVEYVRSAFAGSCGDGPLRVTLDRNVRGMLASDWHFLVMDSARALLVDQVIVEFKFHTTMPATLRELVEQMRLEPAKVSKYRLCREAWGVPPQVVPETPHA